MNDDERFAMSDLLRYAEWTQKFWRVMRSNPDMVEIDMAITEAKELLEVKPMTLEDVLGALETTYDIIGEAMDKENEAMRCLRDIKEELKTRGIKPNDA